MYKCEWEHTCRARQTLDYRERERAEYYRVESGMQVCSSLEGRERELAGFYRVESGM